MWQERERERVRQGERESWACNNRKGIRFKEGESESGYLM